MLPAKYALLQQASAAGIETPATLFLSFDNLVSGDFETLLSKFIDQNKSDFYIVRSCVNGEDSDDVSMAGHFESSGRLKAEKVSLAVADYFQKNQVIQTKILEGGQVNLMVQPFISAEVGGVVFSRWKYFSNYFVGEMSSGGAEASVEGIDSNFFLLSKEDDKKNEVVPKKLPAEALKTLVQKCEKIFNFPLDIEWVANKNSVTLVQVRPMTRPLQALKVADKAQVKLEKAILDKTCVGSWQINDYAETFGVLSPLSFSVLETCFKQNQSTFQALGFKAENFNFLARSRNGQVYANPTAQSEFFKLKSWSTPFWQTAHEATFKRQVSEFYQNYQAKERFDLALLGQIFGHWQIANFYAAQRQNKTTIRVQTWTQEYEVLVPLPLEFPVLKEGMTWADWRELYKQWWLFELAKLKQQVSLRPSLAFANIEEVESVTETELLKRAEKELPFSGLDFPADFAENTQRTAVAVVKGSLTGKAFVVLNPKMFRGDIPAGSVLVAPYFENSWVTSMDHLTGIILEQGGQLSHSAIVAREKNIPYYIGWAGATQQFKTGDLIET